MNRTEHRVVDKEIKNYNESFIGQFEIKLLEQYYSVARYTIILCKRVSHTKLNQHQFDQTCLYNDKDRRSDSIN